MTDILKGLHPSVREAIEEGDRLIRAHEEAKVAALFASMPEEQAREVLRRQVAEQEERLARLQEKWDEAHGAITPGPDAGRG
jgi:hypothetical protein